MQGEAQKKLEHVIANDLLLKALTTKQCPLQGEAQKKLVWLEALTTNAHCAGVDDATSANADGELLVLFDPLDGSSNIDINMPTGTIFSILPYQNQGNSASNADFLQKGTEQLASGYLLYGASTVLSFTFNDETLSNQHGVVMFSLDPDTSEFILIKQNIQIDTDTCVSTLSTHPTIAIG